MRSIDTLIEELGVPHRAKDAYWALLGIGAEAALPAVREALKHENADVRYGACRLIDHFFIPEALGELLALTNDPDARVRAHAFHGLACDHCKADGCMPDEAQAVASALEAVKLDPDPFVRAMAVGVLGKSSNHNERAVAALQDVIISDPSPAVRKKARMLVPGGAIYERTARERARRRRRDKTAA